MRPVSRAALAAAALLAPALAAQAAVVTYNLVPGQSQITLGGVALGSTLNPQTANSNRTSYSGAIRADRTVGGFQYLSGVPLDAATQAVNQQPAVGGGAGSAPADYGLQAQVAIFTALLAVRNASFGFESVPLGVTPAGAITGGDVTLNFATGTADYNSFLASGTQALAGNTFTGDADDTPATLTVSGNVETLTIPVDATFTTTVVQADDTTITAVGQLVATRVVPEPAAAALLAPAVLGLRRRR